MVLKVLELIDHCSIQGVKADLDVWEVAERQLFSPLNNGLELCNGFLLVLNLREKIVSGVDLLGLLHVNIRNHLEHLRELLVVLTDDVEAILRVLPVLSHVFGTVSKSSMLVVVEVRASGLIRSDEPHEVGNVHFLGEVFEVETDVNYLFSPFLSLLVKLN